MIDYYDILEYDQNDTFPSHFEYVTPNYQAQRNLKQLVFTKMRQVEGWCPDDKISVMMDLVFNHQPDVIVEIGVFGGKSLIPMAFAAKYVGKGLVYGIDPWAAIASAKGMEDANYEWWSKLDHNKILTGFLAKVSEFSLKNQVEVLRATSEEAHPIEGIGLLHIDGNHSEESSLFDVKKWVPLVKSGGIIVFDDINWVTTKAAVAWLDRHCYRVTTFHGENVWGIWVKR